MSKIIFLLAFFSVFQGMVLPGTEQFGVSPFLLVQILLFSYVICYWGKYDFIIPEKWTSFSFWFSAFALISIVSAFILPMVFSGMRVYTPKGGVDEQYMSPGILVPSASNLAQAVYLLLYWVSILFFVMRKDRKLLDATSKAYLMSGIVVCFFSYYQLISILFGIYYPTEYLLNNATFGIAADTNFSFLPRINSTFTEPSFYAMFMASFVVWTYIQFINSERGIMSRNWLVLLIASLFSLLISASSTGFVALTLFFVMHTFFAIFHRTGGEKGRKIILTVSLFFSAIAFLYFFIPGVDVILNTVIFDKGSSDSSLHRLASDRYALTVLSETNFLGAGLGSNRPSSFVAFLLSNVGVLGTFCILIAAGLLLLHSLRESKRRGGEKRDLIACEASGWALLAMLIAKILGGPDLSFPPMWILVGYFILSIRQIEIKNKLSALKK
ncbi:hypothetical protein [Janthinobacterium sp. BJB301]|uniref:hypothetical protein n=1 Tax=Janthinobacterium sp. BJB301 TaxID=1560195 RepID=UPI00117B1250|nr:hypothetical protein [Janthinobacterium sp. BJB301]